MAGDTSHAEEIYRAGRYDEANAELAKVRLKILLLPCLIDDKKRSMHVAAPDRFATAHSALETLWNGVPSL